MSVRRVVAVINGGWIYAGNLTESSDYLTLTEVVSVCKWTGGQWFAGMIHDPTDKVTLKKLNNTLHIPRTSLLYMVDVDEKWGLN